jgi:tyrosine-protein kinase Etk/Wzc
MKTDTKVLEAQRYGTQAVPLDPPVAAGRQVVAPEPASPGSSEEITLRSFMRVIIDGRTTVIAAIVLAVLGAGVYLEVARPVYHADTLLQAEETKNRAMGIPELASLFVTPPAAGTETEILRSRMLVGAVIRELRLDVEAVPRYFPVVGEAFALRRSRDKLSPAMLGLSSFAWGGERIEVLQLEVPPRWEGEALTVVARGDGRYELLDPDGTALGTGEVGKPLVVRDTTLQISELTARENTRFQVRKISMAVAIEKLRKELVIEEKGKNTGLIEVGLDKTDPALARAILDALGRTYLRQNVERRNVEAERTLEFIQSQLPQLKGNAENAEEKLNAYRKARRGGYDVSAETKASLDRASTVERMLTEMELQASEVRQRFTPSHPAYQALAGKQAQLREERAALDREMQRLPETESNLVRLMRDAKVASELYVQFLNHAQELRVVKSGTVANVRILDTALATPEPVYPRRGATMALALALGLVGGIGLVFARNALAEGLEDPDVIERHTGLPVLATIPHSSAQSAASRLNQGIALAAARPGDLAVEALRSLRTSVQLAVNAGRTNVVAIMGPSPSVGKTFVAVNLAHVLADTDNRVLLVDADLRKGTVHRQLGGARAPGVSELLHDTTLRVSDVVQCLSPRLHMIASGDLPANPSELLSSRRLDQILHAASTEYDIVLLDTAPVLAVTDSLLAARTAGTTLLVLRAGQHPLREITDALKHMVQSGVQPGGLIINDMRQQRSGYSYVRYGDTYRANYLSEAEPTSRRV